MARHAETARAPLLRALLAAHAVQKRLHTVVGPLVDVGIRIWLARLVAMAALPAATGMQGAAVMAAHTVIPPLLAFGLATRMAALPLLAASLAVFSAHPAADGAALAALLAAWFVLVGAGPLSLDAPLAAGIYSTALPLAAPVGRALAALSRAARPVLLLVTRLSLAAVLLRHGMVTPLVAAVCLLPLALGLGTRLAVLPLLALTATTTMHAATSEHLAWVLLLVLLGAEGAGPLALDHLIGAALVRRYRQLAAQPAFDPQAHQVVIVGGGFGGLAAARGLAGAPCAVTLIDQHNHHLFQPLLYQVATAALSPADIATPIRSLFRDQANTRVRLGRVVGVDAACKQVRLADDTALAFDTLILATGATHTYFGRDEWEQFAPGLKTVPDATEIRRRLLTAFEHAEAAGDPAAAREYLTFAIIGGGPTGVELAGAVAELARHGMTNEFRAINPAEARVLLIHLGDRLLPTFPPALSAEAARALLALGVELRLGVAVDGLDAGGVTVGGERIPCRTAFWAAGVVASPAAAWIGAAADRAGRLVVGPDLSVPGQPDIFAVGDTASSAAWNGQPVPGLAPAAKQGGAYVARVLRARLAERAAPPPFRYRHGGNLATIGRRAAVVDFGALRMTGPLAWWLWGAVHVMFLASARNRLVVAVQWFWAYLTYGRGIRLIAERK